MTIFEITTTLLGGIGLFLLGMWLMTEGLKLAAGALLQRMLAAWTNTPLRGLLTGAGLTATVQSSSAVTVATVGFVNAGLLTLTQAVWIVYGSNVGTTMTGWIVALTGVEIEIDLYALPAIGIGMLLRLSKPGSRRAAYGQSLAGFAVFLLGIQALKSGFADAATHVDFTTLPSAGWQAIAVYFAIGAVLTFLMQSSSATSAIAISAAAAGVVPVEHAALVLVGADLGTSSTAALSALAATSNARRAAASHVLLNLVTAVFAIAALSLLLSTAAALQRFLALPADPGVTLALFGTLFNIGGVVLMIPVTPPMVGALRRRFTSSEENLAKPQHIDATVLEVPELAVRGLVLEVQRLGRACLDLAADSADPAAIEREDLLRRETSINALAQAIRRVVGRLNRAQLPSDVADDVPALLRALQHYEEVADLAVAATELAPVAEPWFDDLRTRLSERTREALAAADTSGDGFDLAAVRHARSTADAVYERLKARLLEAAADGDIAVSEMDTQIQEIARLHRAAERAEKAATRLAAHLPVPTPPAGRELGDDAARSGGTPDGSIDR